MNKTIAESFHKFGLVIASLALCFAVFEAGSRVFFAPPSDVTITPVSPSGEMVLTGSPNQGLYVETATGVRLRPNTRAVIKNHNLSKQDVEITTNSSGFRGPEIAPKTAQDYRILVLGDSITFGDYVAYADTFPAVMEAYFNSHRPPELEEMTVQVINAGVGGIDLETEWHILQETGLSTRPDLVVVALYLNDAQVSPYIRPFRVPTVVSWSVFARLITERLDKFQKQLAYQRGEQMLTTARSLFVQHYPMTDIDWRQTDWMHKEPDFNRLIYAALRDWGYAWSPEFWPHIRKILLAMQTLSAVENFELAVVFFPVSFQVYATFLKNEPQQQFERLMNELALPHLDVLPLLRAKFQRDQQYIFYDHCHYRPEGNWYIGEAIAEFLLQSREKKTSRVSENL